MKRLDQRAFNVLFNDARTHMEWQAGPVTDGDLREIYHLAKWGPTAANANPARFVFIRSPQAKERLKPHLAEGNVTKTMSAPCTVIMAWDTEFYEKLRKVFPSRDLRSVYAGKPTLIEETAFRNATLQAAYLMLAARALGFDCGPMSGFNREGVDKEFLSDQRWRSNFLCNIGHGVEGKLFPRNPRFDFDEACLDL